MSSGFVITRLDFLTRRLTMLRRYHAGAQLLLSGVCVEALESHELGLSVSGGCAGIVGVLPANGGRQLQPPGGPSSCRFVAIGSTVLDLNPFLAGSLFAGEPHLPSSSSTMADFEDESEGEWTLLVPPDLDESVHPSDVSSTDGWSDAEGGLNDSVVVARAKSKTWRGAINMTYKGGSTAITSSPCTLWVTPRVVKTAAGFMRHAKASMALLAEGILVKDAPDRTRSDRAESVSPVVSPSPSDRKSVV